MEEHSMEKDLMKLNSAYLIIDATRRELLGEPAAEPKKPKTIPYDGSKWYAKRGAALYAIPAVIAPAVGIPAIYCAIKPVIDEVVSNGLNAASAGFLAVLSTLGLGLGGLTAYCMRGLVKSIRDYRLFSKGQKKYLKSKEKTIDKVVKG